VGVGDTTGSLVGVGVGCGTSGVVKNPSNKDPVL